MAADFPTSWKRAGALLDAIGGDVEARRLKTGAIRITVKVPGRDKMVFAGASGPAGADAAMAEALAAVEAHMAGLRSQIALALGDPEAR